LNGEDLWETVVRVLVVEDEKLLAESVKTMLSRASMAVDVVHDGGAALELVTINSYDAIVLDRDLPGVHGDEVCRRVNEMNLPVRILMLTAASRLDEKMSGFELGADDYLAKPFEMQELIARLRALGRRPAVALPPVMRFGDVTLNPFRREVHRDGRPKTLSPKEFAVLQLLMSADGGVVSAEELLEKAWDENANPFTNGIRVTVSTLRKKLGEPWLVATVPGVGYRMGAPVD
jgi:two-component system response regulator VanR